MNIKHILSGIVAFLLENRRTGATTLIKKIAEENDVWVLARSKDHAKEFGDKGISIQDLKFGSAKKPILVDNGTLLLLLGDARKEIIHIEEINDRHSDFLEDLTHQIRVHRFKTRDK